MDAYEVTLATAQEKELAANLISEVYRKSGYVGQGEERPGVSDYLFSPHTKTFVAKQKGELEGTISVFHDAREGLPMDSIFKQELDELRGQGKKIAEVGQFAVAPRTGMMGISLALGPSLSLFRHVLAHCIESNVETICIAVNPKHERFYQLLGFIRWPEERSYPSVNNAPAIGMRLPTTALKDKAEASFLAKRLLAGLKK